MQRIRPWAGSTPFLRRRSLPNAVCFLARVTAGTCRNERDPRRESARCQAVILARTRLRVRARLTSGNITTIVLAGIGGQSTPSTTDIQQSVRGLEVELFAHERELVVLQLFQGLKLGRVRDDSRGVNPEGNRSKSDWRCSLWTVRTLRPCVSYPTHMRGPKNHS